MRMKETPKTVAAKKDCMNCFKNFRLVELQSFHLEHSVHLACRDCIKPYLDSLASAVVTFPDCRLPVNSILNNIKFVKV